MPEDNSNNHDDHWRRLAEELGLPFDEPAPAPVREPSPPPEPVAAQAPVASPADFQEDAEEHVLPSPAAVWSAPVLDPGEAEAKNRVRLEPVAPPEPGDDEGKPRRGRRRRGRGRGERRPDDDAATVRPRSPAVPASDFAAELTDDDVPPADAATEVGEAAAGDPQGPRKRRRRRRRRKPDEAGVSAGPASETRSNAVKPAPVQAVAEEIDEEEDDENDVEDAGDNGQQGGMDADDDEPEEDFSDWNVPSWNDLIASLYRPDR